MKYLSFPVRYEMLYKTSIAYAGYGYGLCDITRREASYKKELDNMNTEVVMAVLFTPNVLTVTLSVMKSAY